MIVNEELGYKLSVDLRCNGVYSYRIVDPLLFYTNVCANVSDEFRREQIDTRLWGELMNALQPALAKLSANRVQYYEIPAHTFEISDALNDVLFDAVARKARHRGLLAPVSTPSPSRRISARRSPSGEETAMSTNATTAASRLVGAQAEAMKKVRPQTRTAR